MTRAVHAVLIAVPDAAWVRDQTLKEAVPVASALGGLLERRFEEATIELVAPRSGGVTRAAVASAFAAARPAAGELFVVLFLGHGIPASEDHPYQSWALTTEELTNIELAEQLHRLPPTVDTVVISDCCYGRGFYTAGTRAWDDAPAPMVCISAAGRNVRRGSVLGAVASQLVADVMAAAEQGASYRGLKEKFRRDRFSGREFHVDARPAARMSDLVLGM